MLEYFYVRVHELLPDIGSRIRVPPSRVWDFSPITSHRQTQILAQYHCQVIIWDRATRSYSEDTPHVWDKRKRLSHSAGVTEPSNVQNKNCNSFFFKIVLPGVSLILILEIL